jgi:imidazolonepropionase-like amidohydrolase
MSARHALSICLFLALIPDGARAQPPTARLLKPARVFDGEAMHEGWVVRVAGDHIEAAGPAAGVDAAGARVIELPGTTLMPGFVEGHSHILLHPYNETVWNDQVKLVGRASACPSLSAAS